MNHSSIILEKKADKIVRIILNRKEKCNALNIELLKSFSDHLESLNQDKDLKAIIISGMGSIFCSGLDLNEASDRSTAKESNRLLAKTLSEIYKSPHFTIATVQGKALGGGAGMMTASDFVIADENCLFGYPEIKRGLVAFQVMTLLKRQLRERDLKELLLLGESISAKRALEIGLINRIVKEEDLISEAMHVARISLSSAPKALLKTKHELMDRRFDFDQDLEIMREKAEKIRDSEEFKEGLNAFFEKRKPNWNL